MLPMNSEAVSRRAIARGAARPHPLARAALADRANDWLERAWRAGLCNRPSLDPETLWARAHRAVPHGDERGGRSGREVADFRFRLDALCASLEAEAALNPLGRTLAHGQLVRVICQRLTLGAGWRDRPEIIEQRMAAPIIVVGQMRAGTTRIHRLLAADPANAGTRFCDSWHPCPPPARTGLDMRPVWSALSLFLGRRLNPWLDTIHPFGVTRPDEELGWLASALDHCAYEAQWRIPAFSRMSEARDPAPVYAEFARILSTDAAFHGNVDRPRVLKVPQFAEDLPALLAQFPDARVVLAVRDPQEIAASAASLVANQMAIQSDDADLAWIEAECRRKITLRQERLEGALETFTGAQASVRFEALNQDWEAQVKRIYAELDLPLSTAALKAMHREQDRADGSAHHSHQQTYLSFGPTRPLVSDPA